jgi:hypothetical protein
MYDFDLGVAWNWEYDADFIALLEASCKFNGLSMLQITPSNLGEVLYALAKKELICRAFFDRASDIDPQFMPLTQWMHENRVSSINSIDRASLTWDKAKLHSTLLDAGLEVPYTIILPAYYEQPTLSWIDLSPLGGQFTIKPSHGSGGIGVRTGITTWEQVQATRQEHATDRYLLQANIVPKQLIDRPAWFRVIYSTGQAYPCWWNPQTHEYIPVNNEDQERHGLHRLEEMVVSISRLCGLDLFSSEIALAQDGTFVVVDYVNDQIDLRLKSVSHEGVPDEIVHAIVGRIVSLLMNRG